MIAPAHNRLVRACLLAASALARDQVLAVGASTFYPLTTAVAWQLG
jgi:ABC-type phosphate transport system substrate-binding protein